jgi:hypothetical protein
MPAAMAMFSSGSTKTRKAQITSLSPDIPFSLTSARIEQHEQPEHPVVTLFFSTLLPDIHAIDYLKIKSLSFPTPYCKQLPGRSFQIWPKVQ